MPIRYRYNTFKNQLILKTRGIGFEEIIDALETGGFLADLDHPNLKVFPNQKILIVKCRNYIYVVPYVTEVPNRLFLKTIYPSRKYTKKYLKE